MSGSLVLVLAGIALWLASGLLPLLAIAGTGGRANGSAAADRLAAAVAAAGSLLGLAGAMLALGGRGGAASASWPVPGMSLSVELDALSALFLLPVFAVPGLAAIYGVGYAAALLPYGRFLRTFQALLTVGMATLVIARNGVLFLVGWEAMAIAAFLLIATEHHKVQTRRAAWIYLVAAHLCTLCLVAAVVLLQDGGDLDWHPGAYSGPAPARVIVAWLLALVGFGLKAGLMPFHMWLPGAHGNAPSHVSAVLSGVLIKMGAYGLLRLTTMLPPLPAWCSALVLVLGAGSALLGIAATFAQDDLKRLLAYSSIENIGIVFLGIGLGMLGRSTGEQHLVVLGFGGALFHVLNHSLFKPLLFLGAGSVIHATGTRELDQLGGLWRRMPRTGACFLAGCAAISGLPLLNGFASEFVLYLALFGAAIGPDSRMALLATAVVGVLSIVGGLALVTFVRGAATIFLGRPRSAAAAQAHESPASMTWPLIVLASACAVVGYAPALVAPWLDAAIANCAPGDLERLGALVPFGLLSALAIGCSVAAAAGLWWLNARRGSAGARVVGTWDCGYADASAPQLQYTGSSFAQAGTSILAWTVRERVMAPAPLELFAGPRSFARRAVEPLLHGMLWPLAHRLAERCARLRFLQRGNVPIYLLYILVVLVALLAWSALES